MQKNTAVKKVQYMIEAMEKVLEFNEKEELSDSDAHKVCNKMFAEFLVDSLIKEDETIILGKTQTGHDSVITLNVLKKLNKKDDRPFSWHKPNVVGMS